MRSSRYYVPTLKETPSEAEVDSHKLMLRAGMIRQLARGIYDYLPLGLRVIRKVEQIVREEMNRAGAHEVLLPVVQPSELWLETGRWAAYKAEGLLATLKDRADREYCLGPTHEEVITDLVRRDVKSYRDLPVTLYQIQTKFRDEIRPRFGLMRGREFIMKDAYSFDVDDAAAKKSYWTMHQAYSRIFTRCGLEFRPVEALTGNIGGSLSHEFQVLADSGEDAVAACDSCEYAANQEKAETTAASAAVAPGLSPHSLVATPGKHTVADVTAFLKVTPDQLVKTLIYETDQGIVAALVRGDHVVNEEKLKSILAVTTMHLAKDDLVQKVTGAPVGFAGPVGLKDVKIIADSSVASMSHFIVGANKQDSHLKDVCHTRDFTVTSFHAIRLVAPGDACPRCDKGKLRIVRGIEVGHVFYLGTKYSRAMKANYLAESGTETPIEMGCYGIGVGRTVAAAIEQNHDENGIIWPVPIAPFDVCLITANPDDAQVTGAADRIYDELIAQGRDVLYDDRDGRAGVKFKDADLIGIPYRIIVGARNLAEGQVEVKNRRTGEMVKVALADAVKHISALVDAERARIMAAVERIPLQG